MYGDGEGGHGEGDMGKGMLNLEILSGCTRENDCIVIPRDP